MPKSLFYMIALGLSFILAACGGDPEPTATPRPTITPFPTFSYVQPTTPPEIASAGESTAEAEPTQDTRMIDRGRGRYEALECGSCHGENAEGGEEADSLIGLDMTEAEFIDFMRSGGEMGADHQYSTNRLSASGGENLYAYLISLEE